MQKTRSQDHQYHQAGIVSKRYFHKLYPKVTEGKIESLAEKNKPAVLFLRPDLFVAFVKEKLKEKGVKEEEIWVNPVSYVDYFKKPFFIANAPEELFSKRKSYEGQNEVRIVVDTHRDEVRNLFNEIGVIELGKVDESIATLQEFYFQDMSLEIRGNKLLYSLAKPKHYDYIDDLSLIIILQQALSDELPEAPMSIEAIEDTMDKILNLLRQRDPNVKYDKATNLFCFKEKWCDIGAQASYKMREHYINYILDRDFDGAGDVVQKFEHFFPKYNMGNYFKVYYDWKKGQ